MAALLIRAATLLFSILSVCDVHAAKKDDIPKDDPFMLALDSAFLMSSKNPTGALEYAGELYNQALNLRNEQYILEAGMLYGDFLLRVGDAQRAHNVFYFLSDSVELAVCDSMEAELVKRRAYVNFYMGEFRLACDNFEEMLAYGKKKGDTLFMATAYTSLGAAYIRTGNLDKALENLQYSLRCYESLNDLNGKASALNNLGGVYTYLSRNDTAKYYFQQALEVNEELGDSLTMVALLINIAGIERTQGNYSESLEKDLQALELCEKILNKTMELEVLLGVGMDYLALENSDQAEHYLMKGLHKSISSESTFDEMQFRNELGKVQLLKNDFAKAKDYLLPGLKLAEAKNNYEMLAGFNNSISEVYAKMGDFKNAYNHFRNYHMYNDSLYNEKTRSRISELEVQYDNEKKVAEINALKNKNTIIELEIKRDKLQKTLLLAIIIFALGMLILISIQYLRNRKTSLILQTKNKQLEEAIAVKTRLFSIVAHDLKNPLNSIIGFSTLLSDKNRAKAEVSNFAGYIKDSGVQSVEMIERLLDWSRLNLNEIPFTITENDLGITAEKVKNDMNNPASVKNIKIFNNIPVQTRCYYDEYSVYSVLSNLVSNAIKFSHEGSEVTINVKAENGTYIVEVKDNGVGVPAEAKPKLLSSQINNSSPGTNNERGTGLGLSLSQEFVNRNGGKMWFSSELNKGSKFFFTLPAWRDN
jgi:signal transduction histidine kinase